MHRLGIVIPYRNRLAHLRQLQPWLRAYFARDKCDRSISYRALVVEQGDDLPFNRGAMKNIGFQTLEADCDYTCFHDVDYLPYWADYSYPTQPTPLVWYGAEVRPIAPGRSDQHTIVNLNEFFGAVALIPNHHFRQVDGYSNDYWGWGFEDTDLKFRFERAGIKLGRRKGTFRPLDHDNEGFKLDGSQSEVAKVNQRLFDARWKGAGGTAGDGLTSSRFTTIARTTLPNPAPGSDAVWEKITVKLETRPSKEQLAASTAKVRRRK